MINQDVLYWIWLAEKCGIASKGFDKLIEKFDNPFDIYQLENEEIEQLPHVNDSLKAKLCEKNIDASYEILKYCKSHGVDIITYADKRYPERLKNTIDPPILLYCLGHFPSFDSLVCIGVVGTRKMSEYGKQSAYKISYELAEKGACVVSGMALGIDGVAACGALSAGGITVAVLGCGLDTVYPSQHKTLMQEIAKHGAVITEYPPKEPPHGYNFPKRNRIISGLSQGVLVVEASVGSGALITARNAHDQGRDIYAVPGKISEASAEGPNALIRDGAYSASTADDILKNYDFLYGESLERNKVAHTKRNKPSADSMLGKYGLYYALNTKKEEEERVFAAKPERKKSAKTEKAEKKSEKVAESASLTVAAPTDNGKTESYAGDSSSALIDGLDSVTRRIFESIPQDKAISADSILLDGVSVSEIITSLTMLELYGLVSSLPGGLYIRK